jgi:anion-transporting  ArsA/GET3 family ATPase
MVEFIEYLKHSGPAALMILAGLVWGKSLIKYFFDESIELKKNELKEEFAKYMVSIEQENKKFQHLLDAKLSEFNVRFSELHQERAKVIKELYHKLIELHSAMYAYTRRAHIVINDAEKEEEERTQRLNIAIREFNNYYMPNKIYFNRQLADKLDKLAQEYWSKGMDFSYSKKDMKDRDLPKEFLKENFAKIKEISDSVESDFIIVINDIENEFRSILGVE